MFLSYHTTTNIHTQQTPTQKQRSAAFYMSVSKYTTKEEKEATTQITQDFTMSYLYIYIYMYLSPSIYICMHLASGSTNTSTPDDGPMERQES